MNDLMNPLILLIAAAYLVVANGPPSRYRIVGYLSLLATCVGLGVSPLRWIVPTSIAAAGWAVALAALTFGLVRNFSRPRA